MDRFKTFFTYALIVVLFWIFSVVASNLILKNSYKNVDKNNIAIEKTNNGFEINIEKANANKMQSYFTGTVKNASNRVIDKQYIKIESFYKEKFMQEKYLAFENMQPGEERKFKLLYEVGNIDEYRVSYVDEIPVNKTIIDDAITSVKGFFEKTIRKLNGLDVKGTAEGVVNSFEPVHVEGEDWQLLFAVLWVIWAAPAGAFIIF